MIAFNNPAFLYGLAALAIPVIIHLFNFRRIKRIYFSNTRFLKNIRQETSSRLKLKHLLVLASRLLFLLFLVLAFSQPYIPAREDMNSRGEYFIYLDNSLSMSAMINNDVNTLEAGIRQVNVMTELFPLENNYYLFTNDFISASPSSKSREKLEENLAGITFSGHSRTASEIYGKISSSADSRTGKTIFWISDFQASTFGPLVSPDTLDQLYLLPLQARETPNVYIDTVFLENPFLIKNEKNKLNIHLYNDGPADSKEMLIRLFVNEVQLVNNTVDVPANSSYKVTYDINFPLDRVNLCRLSIDDTALPFDNDFYFILTLSERISIIEITDTDSTTPVEKVYGNQSLFEYRSFPSGNPDYNLLRKADLVVLNQVDLNDPTGINLQNQLSERDGSLFIIPSPESDPGDFFSLEYMPVPAKDSIPLRRELSEPDLSNPFFADIFESAEVNFTMPSASQNFILPGTGSLIRFKDGRVFLGQYKKTYIVSCPLESGYTDFQNHALFVPVMYRMAILGKKSFHRLYYPLNETLIYFQTDTSITPESLIKLKSPNSEIVPAQRIFNKELLLDIPKSEITAGFYEIWSGETRLGAMAYNFEKKESQIKKYNAGEIRNQFSENSTVRVFNIKDIDNFGEVIKSNFLGIQLWKYCLIFALFFLLAEVLLLRFL